VALGTLAELRNSIGGDCLTIQSAAPPELARKIGERFEVRARVVVGQVRIETEKGHELIPRLMEAFGSEISSIALGKPTLEDVFIERTGHKFWEDGARDAAPV
jgi:ABC-2 type transport system ATP-binding protein